ncbi:HCP-like protein [Piromyces finnis]|uniref:HCP-like protein n=1 Tax=Piromyces finnis TaxID=1754191 RepID=A0A1Y1VB91_9FUNG|nr:HCP-like protein [Piromyces finnis]|eukprot:ORX51517.1 HCP-like protein [Piromyces finnis]
MSNKNLGLASPPLTPPNIAYNNKQKSQSSEAITSPNSRQPRKNQPERYKNNRLSYVSTTSSINTGISSYRKSTTLPDLQNFVIPEGMMPVGPNGEKIPIMIPDGNGNLIPYTGAKKSKKNKTKSRSNSAISQLASPALSEEIEESLSPVTPRLREKSKSNVAKKGKRQSLLIPLSSTMMSPSAPQSGTATPKSGELSGTSSKSVPLFIIPTGPDGKIDPSLLPTPMSSQELALRQKEYEESLYGDSYSFMSSPRKMSSVERLKCGKHRKNSISSMKSFLTTPGNFLKSKSDTGGEFGLDKKKGKKSKGLGVGRNKNDTVSLFSVESNLLDGVRNRSESSPNIMNKENKKNDDESELSSTNFSLENIDSNNSSVSFYDEESADNVSEVLEGLSPEKKDSTIILKKKLDDALEASKTIKDHDLRFANLLYVANNIQLLPVAIHEVYRKNLMKIMKKTCQSTQHGDSLYLLGNLYASGFPGITTVELNNFKPNYNKAYNCFFQAFKSNHKESCFTVGVCHELGLGTRADQRKAFQIYQKASTLNHPGAMCRLGLANLNGELGLKTNLKEGVRWLRLSTMYANKQYPQAFYHLSTIYERGIPNLIIRDNNYAVQLLNKAATLGHIQSQYKLGLCYEHGRLGVEVDAKTSIQYFGMAAAKGHGESMFELAGWYLTGSQVSHTTANDKEQNNEVVEYVIEPSNEIAFQWTRKAAERNLPKAEFAIGYFYDNGIGINRDAEEAMKWYYVASTHKDPKAIKKMSEKSCVYWLNGHKSSELPLIEKEIFSRPCNYDLIEDELNLHFTTETKYESILNGDTIKLKKKSDDDSDSVSSERKNSSSSSSKDKCIIM